MAASLALPSLAFASGTGYQPTQDTDINVTAPLSLGGSTGTLLFNVQEGLYRSSGASVPHSYLWVNVNGQPLVAIDPPVIYGP